MKEPLIHKYEQNGRYIVLDINSGSVHIVEKIVYDLLDYYSIYDRDEAIANLKKVYKENELSEAYNEIIELEKNGYLFTPHEDIEFDYNKQNVIKAMCLHVAHDCNLKCEYCFASQGNFKGERKLMGLETGKRAIDFLANNSGNRKNLEVDFFGGEPLMNFSTVKEIVRYARNIEKEKNKRFRFTITTNALLLDDDIIDFINDNMENVVLSLDGRKEINDRMRKTISDSGSYDIIIPKIKNFIDKRKDKDYYVRGTFTSENIDFSSDAKDMFGHGFKNISIEPVVAPLEKSYSIKQENLEDILKEYEKFALEYTELTKKDPKLKFFHFMIDLDQGPCAIKRSVGCGAGCEYIAVTPEGDIYPCHQFVGEESFKLGNLNEGIINKDLVESFKNSNVHTKDECIKCWARYYCSGGCHANAYYTHNDILKPYKIGCEMEKKRIECSISILANKEE